MVERLHKQERESRGGYPSITELLIVVYVFGFIYGEMKALWNDGLLEYAKDLWNFVDFGSNFFYMNWIFLRCVIVVDNIILIIIIVIIHVIIALRLLLLSKLSLPLVIKTECDIVFIMIDDIIITIMINDTIAVF